MEACVTIGVTLIGLIAGPITEYISDIRSRNSWDNILKEIDVFNRWIDEGRIATIDRLYCHIEESINARFKKNHFPVYWFFVASAVLVDLFFVIMALENKQLAQIISPVVSLVWIAYTAIKFLRDNAEREARRKAKACIEANTKEVASHIRDAQTEEEKLARLERNDAVDARWVAHLSRGSIYNKRVFSEYWHAARERAEEMELKRLVDRVMQLPEEPPTDEG